MGCGRCWMRCMHASHRVGWAAERPQHECGGCDLDHNMTLPRSSSTRRQRVHGHVHDGLQYMQDSSSSSSSSSSSRVGGRACIRYRGVGGHQIGHPGCSDDNGNDDDRRLCTCARGERWPLSSSSLQPVLSPTYVLYCMHACANNRCSQMSCM